jgi:PAS domain S-box-containing protein
VITDVREYPGWIDIPESRWIRSHVAAPIRRDGQVIGFVSLDSATTGFFNDLHAERLQAFADQAALAIRNAQLFAAERDQRFFAEALSDTATALTGSLSLNDVTGHVLENIGRVVPHDAANIMLIDYDAGLGKLIGSRGYEKHGEKKHSQIPLAHLGTLLPGQAIIINDTRTDPRWIDLPADRWIRAYMGTPIHLHGQIVGLLNLDSATPGFFTEAHAARLQAFADQAALAIRSAQLFERVQRHAAELEQRVEERTRELEQQRAQLQAILDSMNEGVIYDENFHVKYINHALTQLTGYPAAEFVTHPYLEPLCRTTHTPEQMEALKHVLYDTVDQRGIWRGETRLQRRDNSVFDAALTATSVCDLTGQIIGAVTVIRDISQEKALQEQRVRFIANASHELRTPLANIKTRLYLLQRQPERAAHHIKILNQVADSMTELVENLLDVSRFERGAIPLHRRATVLQDLINQVVRVQRAEAERKKITLDIKLHPTPLYAYVDPQRLAQVITNLVSNAINYTHEGGQIAVELEPEPASGRVLMRVRDTGIGIAPDMLAQIFEPFFRVAERIAGGTGLGLTIAREIVHLHGGQIGVESEVGQGSVFTVKLDLLPDR